MKVTEIVSEQKATKTRLDPKCWTGKKIGNPKTKVKGGVRVNNCVPAESIEEAANPAQQAAIAVNMKKAGKKPKKVDEMFAFDTPEKAGPSRPDELARRAKLGKNPLAKGSPHASEYKTKDRYGDMYKIGGPKSALPEDDQFNPEYDDEAGMADNNIETMKRAVDGLDNLIHAGDNLPEWCQEKIAVAKSMLVTVWDYMASNEHSEDPDIAEMYEALEQLVYETAEHTKVDVELVWETFEAMDDKQLFETAAWRRSAGKSKKGGLNAKGVASYRRENPGSHLQMAVTTKPSKLKPGSKAAKRRKSFCARMGGVDGPMKKPNGEPTRKALALRKWNC